VLDLRLLELKNDKTLERSEDVLDLYLDEYEKAENKREIRDEICG